MRRTLKSNSGFSLVELMVVVAIIGILAAIAVPNFQKFTAKSKQSEVKSSLSALYSAERAFQAEWQTYTSSFEGVGYAPVGTFRYEHGFSGTFPGSMAQTDYPSGYTLPATNSINTAAYCVTAGTPCVVNQKPIAPGAVSAAAVGDNVSFKAEGRGDIDGDATIDVWTIDQKKNLTNVTPDLET